MTIVDKLKSAHSFHGDPLHREAWEEIESLYKIIDTMANRANDIRLMGKVKLLQRNHIICEDEDGNIILS